MCEGLHSAFESLSLAFEDLTSACEGLNSACEGLNSAFEARKPVPAVWNSSRGVFDSADAV